MSTKEAQKNASRAYRKRQKAAGSKQIGFLLSPEALKALESLAKVHGSKAAAVNAALISAAAPHVPIQRLDVDAEYRLQGPVKPEKGLGKEVRERVRQASASKIDLDLPIGPVARKPGELAKKGKK